MACEDTTLSVLAGPFDDLTIYNDGTSTQPQFGVSDLVTITNVVGDCGNFEFTWY